MSAHLKPKGGPCKPSTRLKLLSPEHHDLIAGWRTELIKGKVPTNQQLRDRIAKKFKIRLNQDTQLSRFWTWYEQQQNAASIDDLLEQQEEIFRSRYPDWTPEKVRETCIQIFIERTAARDDLSKFATAVKLAQSEERGKKRNAQKDRELDQEDRKIVLLEQKAAAYDRAQAAISEAKKSKGVITPETLRRIEEELRLL